MKHLDFELAHLICPFSEPGTNCFHWLFACPFTQSLHLLFTWLCLSVAHQCWSANERRRNTRQSAQLGCRLKTKLTCCHVIWWCHFYRLSGEYRCSSCTVIFSLVDVSYVVNQLTKTFSQRDTNRPSSPGYGQSRLPLIPLCVQKANLYSSRVSDSECSVLLNAHIWGVCACGG